MEKAFLIGLNTGADKEFENSMEELKSLAEACDFEVTGIVIQNLSHPVSATYIGSGKIEEICQMEEMEEIDKIIFEDTLSPVQLKNLQKQFKAEIMDRTGLILEIFSKRARTREAKLQVESAKLQYMMPRLIGMWEAIGRQGGGSGSTSNKGVGETQLELDRRWIQKRINELRHELDAIEHDRDVQRRKREKGNMPLIALVGYTNAGKSTIMNRIMRLSRAEEEEKQVFEKDMLFATLDTSVRRIELDNNKNFLLSDTVGFIDKLPHTLVKAFRSTLDEIKYADLLLEVVDISDERHTQQMQVTKDTLHDLGADVIPCIHVLNKADKCMEPGTYPRISADGDSIYMSAADEKGLDMLIEMIQSRVYSGNKVARFIFPYDKGNLLNDIHSLANVVVEEYRGNGVYIEADVPVQLYGRIKNYDLDWTGEEEEQW